MTATKGRPAGEAERPSKQFAAAGPEYRVDAAVLGAQLRRRHGASLRLPPLPDGRREPLDVPPVPGESADPWHRAERLEPLWELARELMGVTR